MPTADTDSCDMPPSRIPADNPCGYVSLSSQMEGVLNLRNNRPLRYGKPFSGRIRFTSA